MTTQSSPNKGWGRTGEVRDIEGDRAAVDPKTEGVLRVEGISKEYSGSIALKDVSLEVPDGQFLTLLGPSGCGKSTLLRLINGLIAPTRGSITYSGKELTGVPPEARPFNMVFQNYALFPHLSVYDNIAYGLRVDRIPEETIRNEVERYLKLVRMGDKARRGIADLSGGESQRIALARALVKHPSVLLLDEPLGALDLQLRKHMQIELRVLQRQLGMTFIYVTHDQEEALIMSDNIAVMRNGLIEQLGTPEEVYRHPRSRFVAEFVGETSVLECRVKSVRETGGMRFVACSLLAEGAVARDVPIHSDEAIALDQPGWVVVRPESIRVVSDGNGRLRGLVRESLYLGSAIHHIVELACGTEIRVAQPGKNAGIDEGDRISLDWTDSDATLVLS
jgi:spermidine/putrescine transport system ATP-binding protein